MGSEARPQLKKLTSMPFFRAARGSVKLGTEYNAQAKISVETGVRPPACAAQRVGCARAGCGANQRGFAPRHGLRGAVAPNLHRLQWEQ